MRIARPAHLHVKLTLEERERLRELGAADGIDASDTVRLLLNREHEARFGPAAVKSRRTTA
ncbi:MAG: hypothetical protein ACRENE_32880 [Polyangiaceae bacterium]